MKKTLIFIFLLLSIILINNYSAKDIVTLSKCIDGDTARFIYNNEEIKVRFIGIDTPELAHEDNEEESYAKEASEYTCNKLKNANIIEIEFDPNSDKQDKYERYLAWIFIDDDLLQELLVKNGYAKVKYVYDKYQYLDKLYTSEKYAKEKKLGIWNDDDTKKENNNEYIPYLIPIISILILLLISRIIKR